MLVMKVTKLNSNNTLRRYTYSIGERSFGMQYKLFHSSSVVCDKSTVMFENILCEENRVRTQNKLKKYEQPMVRKIHVQDNHREAAVLIPLCTVNGEPSLLFMVRSNLIPAHRGEVW
jgi:hypothetical protein